jgi:soluble lytic murein transglycosylase-like protein
MPATINLQTLIYQQALSQGVPPAIALAVAQKESSTAQWTTSGNLVTGAAGEIGVFQLMPATAAGLGVDPADVNQNISGGISLLAQLYAKYGDWAKALSAYNSGSPTGSPSYASSVLAAAGSVPTAAAAPASIDDSTDSGSVISTPMAVGLVLGGIALAWWALD